MIHNSQFSMFFLENFCEWKIRENFHEKTKPRMKKKMNKVKKIFHLLKAQATLFNFSSVLFILYDKFFSVVRFFFIFIILKT